MKDIFLGMKIYGDICKAIWTDNMPGVSLKELKKKYQMRTSDMRKCLDFLYEREWMYAELFEFDEDGEERAIGWEDIDGKCIKKYYIRVGRKIEGLREKIQASKVNPENISFLQYMKNIDIYNSLRDISKEQIRQDLIICKKKDANINLADRINKRKLEWIRAIVSEREVTVHLTGKGRNFRVLQGVARGLYYNPLLERYRCVLESLDGEHEDEDLSDILKISVSEGKKIRHKDFDIEEYIKKRKKDKIVLRLYKSDGGKVFQKLQNRVWDSDMCFEDHDEFYRITFDTDDALQYTEVLKSYGKTVIVEEPETLRKEILDSAYKAFEEYGGL